MGFRRHYAIVMDRNGNVVAENSNNDGEGGHAERRAIRKASTRGKSKKLRGGTIIVIKDIRKTEKNHVHSHTCGQSRPCHNCMNYIKVAGISNIVFTVIRTDVISDMCWEWIKM